LTGEKIDFRSHILILLLFLLGHIHEQRSYEMKTRFATPALHIVFFLAFLTPVMIAERKPVQQMVALTVGARLFVGTHRFGVFRSEETSLNF